MTISARHMYTFWATYVAAFGRPHRNVCFGIVKVFFSGEWRFQNPKTHRNCVVGKFFVNEHVFCVKTCFLYPVRVSTSIKVYCKVMTSAIWTWASRSSGCGNTLEANTNTYLTNVLPFQQLPDRLFQSLDFSPSLGGRIPFTKIPHIHNQLITAIECRLTDGNHHVQYGLIIHKSAHVRWALLKCQRA